MISQGVDISGTRLFPPCAIKCRYNIISDKKTAGWGDIHIYRYVQYRYVPREIPPLF